jgi:hypothetical protein
MHWPTIAVIVPLGRPHRRAAVDALCARQTRACDPFYGVGSPFGVARNRAMQAARQAGFDVWVTMDDDDHYSDHYVASMVDQLLSFHGNLVCHNLTWALYPDGLYRFETEFAMAGAACGWLHTPIEFNSKLSADADFVGEHKRAGLSVRAATAGHYVYDRTGRDHVVLPQKQLMLAQFGGGRKWPSSELPVALAGHIPPGGQWVSTPSSADIFAELNSLPLGAPS